MRTIVTILILASFKLTLASWSPTTLDTTGISCIAANDNIVIVGTSNRGILLSLDTGNTWTDINTGLPYNNLYDTYTNVNALLIMNGSFYAGLSGSGVYKSSNNGENWQLSSNGLSNMDVWTLIQSKNRLLAGTNGVFRPDGGTGVFVSDNNATSWTGSSSGIPALSGINCFAVDDSILVTGTNGRYSFTGGVFYSINQGTSWLSTSLSNANRVNCLAAISGKLFAGIPDAGVFVSYNKGADWSRRVSGLTNLEVQALAVTDSLVLVGTWGGGVFVSSDDGQTWNAENAGLVNTCCKFPLEIDELVVSMKYVFAVTGGGVYRRPLEEFGQTTSAINKTIMQNYKFTIGRISKNQLSVNAGNLWTKHAIVRLSNLQGKVIPHSFHLTNHGNTLNISYSDATLPSGSYILTILDRNTNYSLPISLSK